MHIGGDQLTRERFSGAKRLRALLSRNACLTEKQRLQHMQPITFELWHAGIEPSFSMCCLMNIPMKREQ